MMLFTLTRTEWAIRAKITYLTSILVRRNERTAAATDRQLDKSNNFGKAVIVLEVLCDVIWKESPPIDRTIDAYLSYCNWIE